MAETSSDELNTSLGLCLGTKKHHERSTPSIGPGRSMTDYMKKEFEITWRMLANNLLAAFAPGVIFTTAACLHQKKTAWQTAMIFGKAVILFLLYNYVFDASNQARGADEDRVNKPYRPIPRGLLTPAGCLRRFWVSMVIYTVTGYLLGVLRWVLLWQLATVTINIWCSPRHYLWCKPPCMAMGVFTQLAGAWQLVDPIGTTGTWWITFMTAAYTLPLIYEDVRDMAGDEFIGRRTPALILGPWPIRIWFATFMIAMPILTHLVLFMPTEAMPWRIAMCDLVMMAACWTAAVRSLTMRNSKADRITYQLFISTYIVVLISGCILWV